jgi:hypothetical protein
LGDAPGIVQCPAHRLNLRVKQLIGMADQLHPMSIGIQKIEKLLRGEAVAAGP